MNLPRNLSFSERLKSTLCTKLVQLSHDGGTIETLPTSTLPAAQLPLAGALKLLNVSAPPAAVPLYVMQPPPAGATGTYCLKMARLVALTPGSLAIAARPAAVGVCTAPPPTEMKPTGLRS